MTLFNLSLFSVFRELATWPLREVWHRLLNFLSSLTHNALVNYLLVFLLINIKFHDISVITLSAIILNHCRYLNMYSNGGYKLGFVIIKRLETYLLVCLFISIADIIIEQYFVCIPLLPNIHHVATGPQIQRTRPYTYSVTYAYRASKWFYREWSQIIKWGP